MLIYNATESQIADAARRVGARVSFGKGHGRAISARFGRNRDVLPEGKYLRRGEADGRRMPRHLCWHGHRDLFRELFKLAPDARIKSALADYRGAEDFERQYRATRHQAGPCDCEVVR